MKETSQYQPKRRKKKLLCRLCHTKVRTFIVDIAALLACPSFLPCLPEGDCKGGQGGTGGWTYKVVTVVTRVLEVVMIGRGHPLSLVS